MGGDSVAIGKRRGLNCLAPNETGSLVAVNDHQGHAAVLALFDKAIAGF